MQQLYGHSITYRIAIGPQQGRTVFTLQSLPPVEEPKAGSSRVAKVAGFSVPAGTVVEAHKRDKLERLERLYRYIAWPAVSEKRPSLVENGRIRYELKTPYRDGTTQVMLLRASCPPPCEPAFGSSKSLRAILSNRWTF